MGTCIEKIPHSCGTSDGLQVFEDENGLVSGWCFPCAAAGRPGLVPDPYGDMDPPLKSKRPKKSPEQIQAELDTIKKLGFHAVPERTSNTSDMVKFMKILKTFRVRVGLSEQDGKAPAYVYFPITKGGSLTGYKVRVLGTKTMWTVGASKGCDPFGWEVAKRSGARLLVITEGEFDAVAGVVIANKHTNEGYEDHKPAFISVTKGAAFAKAEIQGWMSMLRERFDEVAISFDDDEPGQAATRAVVALFPEIKVVTLPEKDLNECLLKGRSKAAYKAFKWSAKTKKISRIIFGEDIHEEARKPAEWGQLTWPWPGMNELTRGISYGCTYYIGSGTKMGKSEVVNALGAHFIEHDGVKVFMAKPEEANNKTYKMMASKLTGKIFHDPKRDFDEKAYDRAGLILNGNLALLNLYQTMSWEDLEKDIQEAVVNWGAKAVFIDPLTPLTNGMAASAANEKLQEITGGLSVMSKDLEFASFIFCHLKAPDGSMSHEKREKEYALGNYTGFMNCPHEFGGKIFSSQFTGGRSMMRSCNYMFGLEGNKDEKIPENLKDMRRFVICEDREYGEVGGVDLFWNRETGLFKEV